MDTCIKAKYKLHNKSISVSDKTFYKNKHWTDSMFKIHLIKLIY